MKLCINIKLVAMSDHVSVLAVHAFFAVKLEQITFRTNVLGC